MTISRRKLVGAAGLLPPFAAAFTLSSAVKASEPEMSDAESCSVVFHFDESESFGFTGFTVHNNFN